MAAVVLGVGHGFTACSDDDDDDTPSEEQQRQEQQKLDERDAAWSVLCQLVDPTTAGDDWTTQTFEPTIGEEIEDSPLSREVRTNTLANAAQRFANLVGLETMDSTTTSYTWTNPLLGTLTYERSNDGLSLATVTVAIKAVPRLQKIVYRRPGQTGENLFFSGDFDGRAYYRFGDVVRKMVNGNYEYWLCVRPSFGPEGKGDSHWVTFSRLDEKHRSKKLVKPTGKTFTMPKGLGEDKENMENLGEMISFIVDYNATIRYYNQSGDDYFFHDFSFEREDYHNTNFWEIVTKAWDDPNLELLSRVFDPTIKTTNALKALVNSKGLRLIYGDPSWSWFGWKCTMKVATLKGTDKLLAPTYGTVTKDMAQCDDFDAFRFEKEDWQNFFGDNQPYFFVRHATGKQLAGGYDKKNSLSTINPDITDVYVYYKYCAERGNEEFNLARDPEYTQKTDVDYPKGFTTRPYFVFGDVVTDDNDNRWICIQPSRPDHDCEYSYFISFDKCVKKNGSTDFTQLPSLPLAKMLAFTMICNQTDLYAPNLKNGFPWISTYKNIVEMTGWDYDNYMLRRDTPAGQAVTGLAVPHEQTYANILYKHTDGKPYILRSYKMSYPYKNGLYEGFFFNTVYERDIRENVSQPRKMSVEDMSVSQLIPYYADEPFVGWPWLVEDKDATHLNQVRQHAQAMAADGGEQDEWYNQANQEAGLNAGSHQWYNIASRGKRTQAAPKDTKQWQMRGDFDFQTADRGTNMYNEPVLMFAVKRLKDTGKKVYAFEDGTAFSILKLNSFKGAGGFDANSTAIGNSYGRYGSQYFNAIVGQDEDDQKLIMPQVYADGKKETMRQPSFTMEELIR